MPPLDIRLLFAIAVQSSRAHLAHLPRLVHRHQRLARGRSGYHHALRSGHAWHGPVQALWIHGEPTRLGDPAHGDGERPSTSHEVQWGKIETWIQSAGKPNEQATKSRLRELLRG
jgi:hypothetical protein